MILITTIVALTDEHKSDSDEEGGDEDSQGNKNYHYSIAVS